MNTPSQQRWNDAQRIMSPFLKAADSEMALRVLSLFFATRPARPERSQALQMKATILRDMGSVHDARKDLLRAWRLTTPKSFSRYVDEVCLGTLSEELQNRRDAAMWYRRALATGTRAGNISVSAALRRFLSLVGRRSLRSSERTLCIQAVRKSWKYLNLKGTPPRHLQRVARILREADSRPLLGVNSVRAHESARSGGLGLV